MNYPFAISFILHLTFCAVLGFISIRNRPHAMAVPTQTVRWINIVPPVASAIEAPLPVKPLPPVRSPIIKPQETSAIIPEKIRSLPEPKPQTENSIASPAPLPEAIIEPSQSAQTAVASLPGATGLKVDDPDFTFIYYLNIIRNRIQEYWRPPHASVNKSQNPQAMVAFKISRSGKISQIRVEQASGNFLFDQAAQRALYEIASLPPLPDEYGGHELTVHIEFEILK